MWISARWKSKLNTWKNGKTGERRRKRQRHRKIMNVLRPILIYGISIAVCSAILVAGVNYAMDEFVHSVDVNDATPVALPIEKGSGAST